MTIPLTPMLMALQAQAQRPSFVGIQEAATEITTLLDDFTFDEQETRILQILADLAPEDFVRCLTLIGMQTVLENWRTPREVSYLQRLYEDMNGAEFRALCEITKAKVLAVKAGNLERMAEVVEKALNGETTPEIPLSQYFGPSKLTAPGTWARRSYPFSTTFNVDGSIRGKWAEHIGYLNVYPTIRSFTMQLTDLCVLRHIHVEGKNEFVPHLEVKYLADEQHRNTMFTSVNLVGIVFGAGLFAAAKGVAKKAIVGLLQVAMPSAGQVITDHQDEILKLKYGREFLIGWQVVCVVMAAYGFYQLFSPTGKAIFAKLAKFKDDLLVNNPLSDVAKDVGKEVNKVIDAVEEVKDKVVNKGIEPSSTPPGGSGPPGASSPLKHRAPFDPAISLPSVTGGRCVASAKTELEIFYEMKKFPDRNKLYVFQARDGSGFVLAEKTASAAPDTPMAFRSLPYFRKIIDMFDDLESAKKKLIDAARILEQSEIEVGIYKRVLDGTMRYVVIEGKKHIVHPPDYYLGVESLWTPVGHFHHGAYLQRAFHYPAPLDVTTSGKSAAAAASAHVETIFSRDALGKIVEIQYGTDPAQAGARFFVKTINGQTKWFVDSYPPELHFALEAIDRSGVSDADKLAESLKLLKTLDPADYYGGWWASLFQ